MKKITDFLSEFFPFSVAKFSIYLNRRVFVMRFSLFVCLSHVLQMCFVVLSLFILHLL